MTETTIGAAPLSRRERLRQELTAEIKATALRQLVEGGPAAPDQVRAAVGCWGQFHGLVTLEVNDHINGEWVDPSDLYAAAMRTMLRGFGLPDPSPGIVP